MRLGMQEAAAPMFRQEVTRAGGGGMGGGWQGSDQASSLSWERTVLFQLRESREGMLGI